MAVVTVHSLSISVLAVTNDNFSKSDSAESLCVLLKQVARRCKYGVILAMMFHLI